MLGRRFQMRGSPELEANLEKHMGNIFGKLSVASRHELAALAFEEGYVGPEKTQSNS